MVPPPGGNDRGDIHLIMLSAPELAATIIVSGALLMGARAPNLYLHSFKHSFLQRTVCCAWILLTFLRPIASTSSGSPAVNNILIICLLSCFLSSHRLVPHVEARALEERLCTRHLRHGTAQAAVIK